MKRVLALVLLVLAACKSDQEKAAAIVKSADDKWARDELDAADAEYKRALEIVPNYQPALERRGQIAAQRKNPEACVAILAPCKERGFCMEMEAECRRMIRDRLVEGSLEPPKDKQLIDAAIEAENLDKLGCGLLYVLLLIEVRERQGKPVPKSLVDEVRRRIEDSSVSISSDVILGGGRLARAAGRELASMTKCEELREATKQVESSYQSVRQTTNAPEQGSAQERAAVVRTYALRAVYARVTKTTVPKDPDEVPPPPIHPMEP